MKNSFTQFINRRVLLIMACMITLLISAACKRADKEVTMDLLESKLITVDPDAWLGVLTLDVDVNPGSPVIKFYGDNTFEYINGGFNQQGTWSFDYSANRSGQFLTLHLSYYYLSEPDARYQSVELKYSAEQDIFYNIDHDDQSLYPWGKTIYIP